MINETELIVNCSNCGTGHRFDKILIGPNGTPIRCANCKTVFFVKPEDETKLQSPVIWLVKDPDGNTTPFSNLGVLQRVIMDSRAGADWQLSRFGESWRSLGDIEGLRMFFDRRSQ